MVEPDGTVAEGLGSGASVVNPDVTPAEPCFVPAAEVLGPELTPDVTSLSEAEMILSDLVLTFLVSAVLVPEVTIRTPPPVSF